MTKKTRAELDQVLIELDAVLASVCTNAAAMFTNLAEDYGGVGDQVDDALMCEALLERAEALGELGDEAAKQWRALVKLRGIGATRGGMLQLTLVLLTQPGQTGAAGVASVARGADGTRSKAPQ